MSDAALQREDWSIYTNLSVGEILRRTRYDLNVTLEQAEFALRIRASQLMALEDGEIEKLPGRVYALGFVRTYSEYLGLDPDLMVTLFKEQSAAPKPSNTLPFPDIRSETKEPNVAIVMFCLLAAVCLLFSWRLYYGEPNYKRDEIPMLSVDPDDTITQAPPIGIEATAGTGLEQGLTNAKGLLTLLNPATLPASGVILKASQNSWVEVRAPNRAVILSRILKPGEEFIIPEPTGYTMTTGNIGGLTLIVNGQELSLGRGAQVRRNISLSPEDLL